MNKFSLENRDAVRSWRSSRRRARTVNLSSDISDAILSAVNARYRDPKVEVSLGGTVANAYDYPAWSEVCSAIAVRTGKNCGRIAYRFGEIPANKATYSGALANCWDGLRSFRDNRFPYVKGEDFDLAREIAYDGDVWRKNSLGAVHYKAYNGWKSVKDTPEIKAVENAILI